MDIHEMETQSQVYCISEVKKEKVPQPHMTSYNLVPSLFQPAKKKNRKISEHGAYDVESSLKRVGAF